MTTTNTTRTIHATPSRALIHQPDGDLMILLEPAGATMLDGEFSRPMSRSAVILNLQQWFPGWGGTIEAFPAGVKIYSPDGLNHIAYGLQYTFVRDSDGVVMAQLNDELMLGWLADWFGEA